MLQGTPRALFVRFAIPQMIGLLFNSAYTIVDGVFIGRRLGREAMAAAAVAVPLIELLISAAIALAAGAGVLIAVRLGSGRERAARRLFTTAVWITGATGAATALLGRAYLIPLARLLGAGPEVLPQAAAYLEYIVTFAPFQLFSFLLGGMVRNDGRPRLAMAAMIAGAASNILLDYLFMYPLNLGIRGAALATALGPVFSVCILLPHFLLRRGRLYFVLCRLKPAEGWQILVCGAPSFVMECSIGAVTFLYNQAISRHGYGEMGLAAYLLMGYLQLLLFTLFLGMAEGLQPVFSHLRAAGEREREEAVLRFAAGVFLGVGLVSCALIFGGSQWFYRLFAPGDRELTAFAASKSIPCFWGFFLTGLNILIISYWQAVRKTGRALSTALLRSVALPPLLLILLPRLLGREALWASQSAADGLTALAVLLLLAVRPGEGKSPFGQILQKKE